ncbi:Ig-like domain-containing protein, partial [Candidatus Palauibacter sp.]|uniref:Ig-like domain-containing protein n=1 Tax=Candidatus Palauibacter sp. TaxID=3101350 RepID=UPI003B023F0B
MTAATLAALVWASGCGEGATDPAVPTPAAPRPTTITVTPPTAQLAALGATVQLAAEVRDQNGQPMTGSTVTWASEAAAVATVDAAGLVTAVGNGTATIIATAGSASGTAAVTVAQEVSVVTVTPSADTLVVGGTL